MVPCGSLKMLGPKKQDFGTKINELKGNYSNFSNFFLVKNNSLGVDFLTKLFFDNLNFLQTLFLVKKSCFLGPTIFDIPQLN